MNTEQQLFETFKQFQTLYRSKVELTGEKLRKIEPFNLPMDPTQPITYTEVDEISIKMPVDEYEKFMHSWAHYIDLMYTARDNPIVEKEFHKLLMLAQLSK
jgi:hypothetical protein